MPLSIPIFDIKISFMEVSFAFICKCLHVMEKLKIDYETVNEIYIIYDEKHKFLEILHIDTNIQEYFAENKNAKYYDKMPIDDIIIYENDNEEEEQISNKRKKRIRL